MIELYRAKLWKRIPFIKIVMLLGKRTCGKGTVSEILRHLLFPYGHYHTIAMSAVIDEHVQKFESDKSHLLGRNLIEACEIRKKGGLMPNAPVSEALLNEIFVVNEIVSEGRITLFLDGFPRAIGQCNPILDLWPDALGFYSDIDDGEVYRRAKKRTYERKLDGLPQRPDDRPSAIARHLVEWPKTHDAIRMIRHKNEKGLLHFDGMLPIQEQVRLCLLHLGFREIEVVKIMKPLSNPEHEATKIVARVTGQKTSTRHFFPNYPKPPKHLVPTLPASYRPWPFASNGFSHLRGVVETHF